MAGRIPQGFVDELLDRVDIIELIDSRVKLKKAARTTWLAVLSMMKKPLLLA